MSISKNKVLAVFFQIIINGLSAQEIDDSIKVCLFPVKEGIVYHYDPGTFRGCIGGGAQQGISILTRYDSVFHIAEGKVVAVYFYGDGYAIVIMGQNDEFVSYSNLKSVFLHKGDTVKRGTFLGFSAISEEGTCNQLDFMFFKKTNQLMFKKAVEYIRCNISCEQPKGYTL